jgi:NAD(P)-dependent dehydrogenase (short-subunit alcohol dehydrogenase family)
VELNGKVTIVTGAAGGIGGALARRFAAEGARVVVADLPRSGGDAVAAELNAKRAGSALALALDVTVEPEVAGLVAETERVFGPVDLFCANAGVAIGTDVMATTDAEWDRAFAVNVKAHYLAARHLLPGWIARGEGYFLATASAAGLLTQIGSVPYAVTKHAAVAFAEWLAITYGDAGVKVSCLCPQGVNTNMLSGDGGVASLGAAAVRAGGEVLEPDQVADAVVAGLATEQFLVLPHPEVLEYWRRKTTDYDRWLGGMRRLQARLDG